MDVIVLLIAIAEDQSLVVVRPADGKDLTLFAAQAIPKGTRILAEKPPVSLPTRTPAQHLWKQFQKMTEQDGTDRRNATDAARAPRRSECERIDARGSPEQSLRVRFRQET